MDRKFTAVFQGIPPDEGGGFLAYAEELPGAITQGETLEEARDNLKDAIALLLEANRALASEVAPGRKTIREEIALPA